MGKARSKKSVGLVDQAVNWVKKTAAQLVDKGSPMDKLKNRKKYQDEALREAEK
jgi:hypothetical protein